MNPIAALAFALQGGALLLLAHENSLEWQRRSAQISAAIATLLSLLPLSEYLFAADFGIDKLFYQAAVEAGASVFPGRMAMNTAFALVMTGVALLLIDARTRTATYFAQAAPIIALLIAVAALIGHAYQVNALMKFPSVKQMTMPSALAIFLLSLGILTARPRRRLMSLMMSPNAAGELLRWMWPQTILLLLLLGWLRLRGEQAGFYDTPFGTGALVLAGIGILSLLIWRSACALERLDKQRHEVEIALRESEARFRQMADHAPVMVWVTDENGACNYLSESWYEFTGQSPATGLGLGWIEALHPEDRTIAKKAFVTANTGHEAFRLDYRLRDRQGTYHWMIDSGQPRFGESGAFLGFIGSVIDITERKQIEEDLQTRNHQLDTVARASQQLIAGGQPEAELLQTVFGEVANTLDTELFFNYLTEGGDDRLRMVSSGGLSEEQKKHFDTIRYGEFLCGVVADKRERIIVENLQGCELAEAEIMRRAGVKCYAGFPLIAHGRFIGVVAFATKKRPQFRSGELQMIQTVCDQAAIALERARSESALRKSEEEFRLLANAVPQIVWVAGTDGKTVYVNEQWTEFSGLDITQTRNRELLAAVIHPDDRERVFDEWVKAFTSEKNYEVEARFRGRATGEYRWFLIRSKPTRDASGRAGKWFGTSTDITASKLAEDNREKLLASEQRLRQMAEDANRLKDEFVATISHELRTPLNHMLGWVILLRQGKLNSQKTAEALETVERNVRAQNRLVEDLLDVSRIVTGKLQLRLQPVVPSQVIAAAIDSARPAAAAKGVELRVEIEEGKLEERAPKNGTTASEAYIDNTNDSAAFPYAQNALMRVMGDPDRLQQVVWNLISNAIKFTQPGGHVEVRLARVDANIKITVSDTGEGIAPEFLPNVFRRFSQADTSIKRKYGGLGLGLAIVRHLVELHGGEVNAESSGVGEGSRFTVSLPLQSVETRVGSNNRSIQIKKDDELALLSLHPQFSILKGLRVLVVDDDADSRLFLTTLLAQGGVEVRAVSSMREALHTFDEWCPDVLVSDISMPNGDGYDLLREIRERNAMGNALPAVALTAFARTEDRVRALTAGYQMHIAKPVEPRELLIVIANLAKQRVPG